MNHLVPAISTFHVTIYPVHFKNRKNRVYSSLQSFVFSTFKPLGFHVRSLYDAPHHKQVNFTVYHAIFQVNIIILCIFNIEFTSKDA